MAAAKWGSERICRQRPFITFGRQGFISLPPRLRKINNAFVKTYNQILFLLMKPLPDPFPAMLRHPSRSLLLVGATAGITLFIIIITWGFQKLVGEHLKYEVSIDGRIVACLGWASAAWKIRYRDVFIGWAEQTKRKNLHLVVNNVPLLILSWIQVEHLASKLLAMSLKRLSGDWQGGFWASCLSG